ncbi:MAG: centrosomin N-terminal motif 1-containing protein [Promethearchaeota archaeon]
MSQENIDKKDATLIEYEKLIKELKNENASLKMRIVKLEEEIRTLLGSSESIKEIEIPQVEYETKIPSLEKEVIVSNSIFSQDTVLSEKVKAQIVDGLSRRECPICGNTNKALIYENVDRTHIISAYPRLYGKKYKCGECGREWRIPIEM